MAEQTDALLPELHARFATLQKELELERAVVAKIEACDQEELRLYKEEVAAQA